MSSETDSLVPQSPDPEGNPKEPPPRVGDKGPPDWEAWTRRMKEGSALEKERKKLEWWEEK